MARRFYIIDGYNLLHAAGFARARYGPGDLHRARVRLLALLAEHLDEDSRQRMEIVFDSQDPPADGVSEMHSHGMRIRYSIETGEADALIEEMIRDHSAPRQLWVVSSDHRLIDAAKRRRARAVTSETFLDRLFENRIAPRERDASPPKPDESAASTTDWLAFFGFDASTTIAIDADQSDTTLPPIAIPTDQPPPAISDRRERKTPDDTEPASFTSEIAFWQRRIDELFEEPR